VEVVQERRRLGHLVVSADVSLECDERKVRKTPVSMLVDAWPGCDFFVV
jgi:hypothetical protein